MVLKLVSVFGASSEIGRYVVKSLLDDYKVNALTRLPDKFKDLSHPNLTVVKIDVDDPKTFVAAFQGSWAVFATTFSDYNRPEGSETKVGNSVADAAAEVGVEWFIWSGTPTGMPTRAFREKAATMGYVRELSKKTGMKSIFVQTGSYMTNFHLYKPSLNQDSGYVEFTFPFIDEKTYFPLISIPDAGPITKAILAAPHEWEDQEIPVVADPLTIPEIAAIYSKVHNVPARAVFSDDDPLGKIPFVREAFTNFKVYGFFPNYVGREKELSVKARKLYPKLKTWEEWVKEVGRIDDSGSRSDASVLKLRERRGMAKPDNGAEPTYP